MTNRDFRAKYGTRELQALNDYISSALLVLKVSKNIRGFYCSNRKQRATLYLNNGTTKIVDYAQIVTEKDVLK